jgi:hypothetical protein
MLQKLENVFQNIQRKPYTYMECYGLLFAHKNLLFIQSGLKPKPWA